jgi:hypothetical protein
MIDQNYIVAGELPIGLNYKALKLKGLNYIQQRSGSNWTNLNPSDPGVTFLEELCYALTELGYCSSFDIADILTNQAGNLIQENQFFLPQDILTSTAITISDYRKYILNAVPHIQNVAIKQVEITGSTNTAYQVYLQLPAKVKEPTVQNELCNQVNYSLNRSRNLGQRFLVPQVLNRVSFTVNGTINIKHPNDLDKVIWSISIAAEQAIFPTVKVSSYASVIDWTDEINTVFDGPYLNNGFIKTSSLGEKKDLFNSYDLVNVIKSIPEVKGVTRLFFGSTTDRKDIIQVNESELITFDWEKSIREGKLTIYANGQRLKVDAENVKNSQLKPRDQLAPELEQKITPIPNGTFRDINSYFSIQNTLPDVYAVGPNSIKPSDPPLVKAQSNQLKGYLTLFDQVLANQFSQLANLHNLFSFKNSTTGTPSDLHAYFAKKDKLSSEGEEYPAIFKTFSPTYFYQSIYQIPDVRCLLKDFKTFDFSEEPQTFIERDSKSWKEYQEDPYNSYIFGLKNLMTKDAVNISRRNEILNHLLARHGEATDTIDQLIQGSNYVGIVEVDAVVFKSLYLQNYAALSYNRPKAYSNRLASPLSTAYKQLEIPIRQYDDDRNNVDFIFASESIDKIERITAVDLQNFSTFELKMSLLFGFKPLYKDYILTNYENELFQLRCQQINWLVTERRGIILIESILFTPSPEINNFPDLIIFLPAYVELLNSDPFVVRLFLMMEESIPINLNVLPIYVDEYQLDELIPLYITWHNGMLYKGDLHSQLIQNTEAGLINFISSLLDV